MSKRPGSRWGGLGVVALGLALLRGCSSASSSDPGLPGAGAAGVTSSGTGGVAAHAGHAGKPAGAAGSSGSSLQQAGVGGVSSPAGTICAGVARPSVIPADWSEWTDWSCECSLHGPGATGTPYGDLSWEPCELPSPSSVVCERHVATQHAGQPYLLGAFPLMRRDPVTGDPLLQATHALSVGSGDQAYFHFVANLRTGHVQHVLAQASTKSCGQGSSGKGQYIPGGMGKDDYILYHSDADRTKGQEGWVRVPYNAPWPDLAVKRTFVASNLSSDWHASSLGVVRTHVRNDLYPWSGEGEETVYRASQDPDSEPSYAPWMTDEAIFFPIGGLKRNGVWAWSKATGLQPLLRWPGDLTRGAANLGTDGKDMVWVYGEGQKSASDQTFPKLSVMTAPYSLDPATLAATSRRLRSQPGGMDEWRYQVGCGYAARSVIVNDGKINNGLFIVRLSDGVSWTLPGAAASGDLGWGHTLYVDCEHVYMALTSGNKARVGRVRIDSLGPGMAPD